MSGGLFHTLNIGTQSLYASRQGLNTSSHNIANAQTEGYSRQRVELTQRDALNEGNVNIGNGVYISAIDRIHDKYLETQLCNAASAHGNSKNYSTEMSRIEAIFSPELSSTVDLEMNNFFASLSDLSAYPDDLSARTALREQGKSLVSAFRHVDSKLLESQAALNGNLEQSIQQVNNLTAGIASLNLQVQQAEAGDSQANDLRDQRDRLITELSGYMDINFYTDQHGMTSIRGPGQAILVDRGRNGMLSLAKNGENSGLFDITTLDLEGHNPKNITDKFSSGSLNAIISLRDGFLSEARSKNNNLAFTFATEFNKVHQSGFGLDEYGSALGRDFFAVGSINDGAGTIDLGLDILNSVKSISVASTQNSSGDNVIANQLLSLKNEKLMEGSTATFNEYYGNFISIVGVHSLRAKHEEQADELIQNEIKGRRESISGVSLDEEAADLLRWQTAFTASSKIITTIDEMLETVLSLKR